MICQKLSGCPKFLFIQKPQIILEFYFGFIDSHHIVVVLVYGMVQVQVKIILPFTPAFKLGTKEQGVFHGHVD